MIAIAYALLYCGAVDLSGFSGPAEVAEHAGRSGQQAMWFGHDVEAERRAVRHLHNVGAVGLV